MNKWADDYHSTTGGYWWTQAEQQTLLQMMVQRKQCLMSLKHSCHWFLSPQQNPLIILDDYFGFELLELGDILKTCDWLLRSYWLTYCIRKTKKSKNPIRYSSFPFARNVVELMLQYLVGTVSPRETSLSCAVTQIRLGDWLSDPGARPTGSSRGCEFRTKFPVEASQHGSTGHVKVQSASSGEYQWLITQPSEFNM